MADTSAYVTRSWKRHVTSGASSQVRRLVTRARTGVDFDHRGDVIDCHALEMPTRFAKRLTQAVCGVVAIGLPRPEALRLAVRCARDSMRPLRLAILDDITANPHSAVRDVRKRLGQPRSTVDLQLQSLNIARRPRRGGGGDRVARHGGDRLVLQRVP